MGSHSDGDGSIVSAMVGLGYRLEQFQSAVPVMGSTTQIEKRPVKNSKKKSPVGSMH